MLWEVAAQFDILAEGEEAIVVCICNWGLWRGKISLLSEETWLARGIDPGCALSWRGRSTARGIGGEGEVDSIGEEPVEGLLVVCQKICERRGEIVGI